MLSVSTQAQAAARPGTETEVVDKEKIYPQSRQCNTYFIYFIRSLLLLLLTKSKCTCPI